MVTSNTTNCIPAIPVSNKFHVLETISSHSPETPVTPEASSLPPSQNDEDEHLEVGNTDPFNHGKKLFTDINDLRSTYHDISSKILISLGETSLNSITADHIKKCNKLPKKELGEYLLDILRKCSPLCIDSSLETIGDVKSKLQINNLSSEISQCIQHNFEKQNAVISDIQKQITQLQAYSNSLNPIQHQIPATHHHNIGATPTPLSEIRNVNAPINNPTQAIEGFLNNFMPNELVSELNDFLEQCAEFDENVESGHSVTMFGEPYHYNGSKHSNRIAKFPSPITKVAELLHEKYPEQDFNSCLVNKFSGPSSWLPRHSDDEATIAPESLICTVSIGHSTTIDFKEIHGNETVKHMAEPNSLYAMTRKSQAFCNHCISNNEEMPDHSIRYSLTFRVISKKYTKSTLIVGDSNTKNLKFGTGKGTFGHNMPGKRQEALHINDINPADCCGFSNIFVHCGINNLKSYKINNPSKVTKVFDELKAKIEHITILCPKSRLFISPILPTKNREWNQRAVQFNRNLFTYRNEQFGKFETLNFSEFCNEFGMLSDDFGKYWNQNDPLHLGSKGISTLVKIFREKVNSSIISAATPYRAYSDVVRGHSVSNTTGVHGADSAT